MLAIILWIVFLVVVFLRALRLHQTAGSHDRIAMVLLIGAVVLAAVAGFFAGSVHGVFMLLGAFLLPLVLRPLAAKFEGSFGDRVAPPTDKAQHERMLRLRRGELSLDQYFEEGHQEERDDRERLQTLVARRDIAAVLRKHRVSAGQFYGLREYLRSVPDLEWKILGTPGDVETLIQMVAAGKKEEAIARAFRSRRTTS